MTSPAAQDCDQVEAEGSRRSRRHSVDWGRRKLPSHFQSIPCCTLLWEQELIRWRKNYRRLQNRASTLAKFDSIAYPKARYDQVQGCATVDGLFFARIKKEQLTAFGGVLCAGINIAFPSAEIDTCHVRHGGAVGITCT